MSAINVLFDFTFGPLDVRGVDIATTSLSGELHEGLKCLVFM